MNLTTQTHHHPYPWPKPITKITRPSTPCWSHKLPSPPSTTPLLHHLPPQQNHNKKFIPKSPKSNKQITTNLKPKPKLHTATIETTTKNESLCKDWPKTHSHHALATHWPKTHSYTNQNPTTHYHRILHPLPLPCHIIDQPITQINPHHKPTLWPQTTNPNPLRHHCHTTQVTAKGKTTSYWRIHAYLCRYHHHTGFWVWEKWSFGFKERREQL